jgi:NADPH2:quinone reductase
MTVIGTAGTEKGEKLAAEQGAEYTVNHKEEGHLQKAVELVQGRGIDVVLEMLANVNLNRDLEVMAMGGRVVVIGSRGKIEIDPRLAMAREVRIIGMLLMNATEDERVEIYAGIDAGVANGSLRPVVGAEMPLGEAVEAHKKIMESSSYGKIVLVP